jgi:hypothetical protein
VEQSRVWHERPERVPKRPVCRAFAAVM